MSLTSPEAHLGKKHLFSTCVFMFPQPTKADGTEAGNEELAIVTIETRRHERGALETDRRCPSQQVGEWILVGQVSRPNKYLLSSH